MKEDNGKEKMKKRSCNADNSKEMLQRQAKRCYRSIKWVEGKRRKDPKNIARRRIM